MPTVGALAAVVTTAIVVVWTIELAIGAVGATAFLRSGGDALEYAFDARDVLLNGPLMTHGRPNGQAIAFYFYPFYPYVLAAFHALVGDDVSTIFLLNGLAVAMLPALFWHLGWQRIGSIAASIGFVALLAFTAYYCWPFVAYENPSLTDLVFLAIVFVVLLALTRAFERPTVPRLLTAGVLIAFAAATRPSFLTMVGFAPIALYATVAACSQVRLVYCAWLLLGVAIGLLPFAVRNVIAAGQFVVLVSSWIQLPYFLIPPEVPDKPGGFPGLAEALRMSWAIFLRDPSGTLWVEVRKLLFTFGWVRFGPADGVRVTSPFLVVLPFVFTTAVWMRRIPTLLAVVVVAFAVSHVVAMVMAAPWTLSIKSILPLFAVFLFGSVFLLGRPAART